VVGATAPDTDGLFIKDVLSLQEPNESISPPFVSESQLNASVQQALQAVSAGKDIILMECASEMAPGIAKTLSAKLLVVVPYAELSIVPQICKSFGASVIINKVPVSQVKTVRNETVASLKASGITVLGILAEDRALLTFTIDDLIKMIDGQVVNNPEKTSELAENIMLGALTVDAGPIYYNRKLNKVAVIRAERADMQMAALETPTRALVLAGNTPMVPSVRNRAEDKKVPVVTTGLDVKTITSRLENAVLKTRFHQKSKLPVLTELMKKGVDFPAIYRFVGIA
jgi:BioD-like phosphotransacetylase family protein